MKTFNNLINENSPYLLKHAYNTINWYPWSDEALEKAKKEKKPIFLSIGYSSCHWCNVMHADSFEDEEVGFILNKYFVSIKVDKEERPDIDSLYMKICNIVRGNGGWPLTAILTSDAKPFFIATYIPKHSINGSVGLIDLLNRIKKLWFEQKEMLEKDSDEILSVLSFSNEREINTQINILNVSYEHLEANFDNSFGGFGGSPKFPMPHNIFFLLEHYKETKNSKSLNMALKTLDNMYKGGIFDHIGGGFSRYSTDQFWLVPHFEKMLIDNALLLFAYVRAYEITYNSEYKKIAEKIINYCLRELKDENNLYYSSQDADVNNQEGKFYTFSKHEIEQILGKEESKIFNATFGVTEQGNFEGKNILNLIGVIQNNISKETINKIYSYRENRYNLNTDDKILTSWNCMLITSLAEASIVFDNPEYLKYAKLAYENINKKLKYKNNIFTSYRNGKRTGFGFLDDYATYIYACIKLYQVTLDANYIENAYEIFERTLDMFYDQTLGCFYLNSENEKLLKRPIEAYDGATPSGNSIMYYNLIFLANYYDDLDLYKIKNKLYKFMVTQNQTILGFNSFFAYSVCIEETISKVVCIKKDNNVLINMSTVKDFDIVVIAEKSNKYPLINDDTTYYVCKGKMCLPPNNHLSL